MCFLKAILCLADLLCSLPSVFAAWQNLRQSPRKIGDSLCLTKYITDNGQSVVEDLHVCTHEYKPSVIFIHARAHTLAHTLYPSRHKRGKTCRHGCLSKQLHQTETKLNLKPRATLATERLWQIWQGRKGSAAGPKGGRHDGENARCGSERKWKPLG